MRERVLSLAELNRALLARQLLLRRERMPVPRAVERLGALQAQWPPSPYVALWSRLTDFRKEQLVRALEQRRVVKATLMRATLHIVSASDYRAFAPLLEEKWLASIAKRFPPRLAAQHLRDIEKRVAEIAATPRRRAEIEEALGPWLRDAPPGTHWLLWAAVQARAGLVHAPESAAWRTSGSSRYVSGAAWLGRRDADAAALVGRYLAAFGPATRGDLLAWTGLSGPRLQPGIDALAASMRTFRDESGRMLLDLASTALPDATTPAPARFLPKWDSSLLAYAPAERTRILPEEYRTGVIQKNGDVATTFLVDGFVAGTWGVEPTKSKTTLVLQPFEAVPRGARRELADEGARIVRFVAEDAPAHAVRFG